MKELIQITTDRGRYYYDKHDPYDIYWSVSTILGATKPESDVKGLEYWRRSVGDEEADRIMLEGRELGTRFHTLVENYLNGELVQVDGSKEYLMLDQYVNGYFKVHEILTIHNEVQVWNDIDGYKYAGTVDWIGLEDGLCTLVDHKSINKIANARRRLPGYAQQSVGYKLAALNSLPNIDRIDKIRVNYCSHEGFRSYEVDDDTYKDKFIERLQRFYEEEHDKRILEQIQSDKEVRERNSGSGTSEPSSEEVS